jgi:hypothetical protein
MINGLIVFEESPQEVAFKGDDTSATVARQCIICLQTIVFLVLCPH